VQRRQAELQVQSIQEQFFQAQKMEAVGRLAGGIAHDFNNLLTVIGGYAQLLSSQSPRPNQTSPLQQIVQASDRAAELTRQLLSFSRKNVIKPGPVDLNPLVEETSRMMRRLLGEDIVLSTDLQPNLPPVLACVGQLSQVLLNLATNARDAMPQGGQLLLSTQPLALSPADVASTPNRLAGDFVLLTVSDNGHGMDEDVLSRIFDPFFTTKPTGKGTGLGLSTVYGIIHQLGGFVTVSSAPGAGTSFLLHLPVCVSDSAQPAPEPDTPTPA